MITVHICYRKLGIGYNQVIVDNPYNLLKELVCLNFRPKYLTLE